MSKSECESFVYVVCVCVFGYMFGCVCDNSFVLIFMPLLAMLPLRLRWSKWADAWHSLPDQAYWHFPAFSRAAAASDNAAGWACAAPAVTRHHQSWTIAFYVQCYVNPPTHPVPGSHSWQTPRCDAYDHYSKIYNYYNLWSTNFIT